MFRPVFFAHALLVSTLLGLSTSHAEEPKTLLGRIVEWQYPDSKINGATMEDGATLNRNEERAVPSIHCKTVMTTDAPIEAVLEYYKSKLKENAGPSESKESEALSKDAGRSVSFHSDSADRPLAIHLILVNTEKTSTTLVISRAKGESETHIAWSQYERF